MVEKFNPVPHDKHAANTAGIDSSEREQLEQGLEDSFPASDPVGVVSCSRCPRC
jgi:hypothetical protein